MAAHYAASPPPPPTLMSVKESAGGTGPLTESAEHFAFD
jgi:hypothetical protein